MSPKKEPQWDLSQLRLLALIAEEGSLTRVAALTGSPQPAISRKLGKFESECGGRLFVRTGRGLELSDLGKQIYPRVQGILREAEYLSREIVAHAAIPGGEVRLGVLASLCHDLLVPLFDTLRSQFPAIILNISEGSTGQIEQWLSSGTVDLGVTMRHGSRKSVDYEPLAAVDAFLAGARSSPLTREPEVAFRRLHEAPLILPPAPSATRLLLEQLARRHQVTLNIVAEADSTQVHAALAANGGVYAVMSGPALKSVPFPLAAALIVEPKIQRYSALGITPTRPTSRAAREVARIIRGLMTGGEPPDVAAQ